jgi:hypothetical protein
MTQDNRKVPRLECAGTASLQITPDGPAYVGAIADLSARGSLLEFSEPLILARDAVVELTFCVKCLPFRVRAQAKSIRSKTRIGFLFLELRDRTRLQLEDLIEEMKVYPAIDPAKRAPSNLVAFPAKDRRVPVRKTRP